MSQVTWEGRVVGAKGVHCRVAARLSEIAAAHEAAVQLANAQGETADCASMLEILSLALTQGSAVRCTAEGAQAAQAAHAIAQLLSCPEEQ
jgi:phosphotransferase system HPr (HPr) family protein